MTKTKIEIIMYILLFLTLSHLIFFVWNNDFTKTAAVTAVNYLFNDTAQCSEQCRKTCNNDLDCEKKCLSEQCQAESQND